MNNKKKIIVSVLIVLLLIVVISSVTYAAFKWRSTNGLNVSIGVTDNVVVTFYGGTDITGRLVPVDSPSKGIVKSISIKSNLPTSDTFNLYLKINTLPNDLKDSSFRWKLTDCQEGNTCYDSEVDISGNFSTTSMNDFIDSGTGDMLLLEDQSISFKNYLNLYLYFWIDGNVDNAVSMGSKSVDFDLYATGTSSGTFTEVTN